MNSTILRQRLLTSGLADPASIYGCSQSEIRQIEVAAQRPLPSPYVDFMENFGKGAGRFMDDVEIFFPDVLHLKPIAIEMLHDEEEPGPTLPPTAFVFAMRNKEQFVCFSDMTDDPSVQFYMFGDAEITTISATFWQFITSELEEGEHIHNQLKGTPFDW